MIMRRRISTLDIVETRYRLTYGAEVLKVDSQDDSCEQFCGGTNLNVDELLENWTLVQNRKPVKKISPLE